MKQTKILKKLVLMSGNQAIVQGAVENNVFFAAGYPGTPSTEILEELSRHKHINAQWSPNEKVALDTTVGASLGGTRALAAMKHVGLNVASDTLMTLAYTGINAGLVIITADDPGMNSSQNEQDNRNYAKFSKIPLLEPGDSQEAKDFVGTAFEISEKYDTPVLLRITSKVAHGKSIVKIQTKAKKRSPNKIFQNLSSKYAMIPTHARKRRLELEKRMGRLMTLADNIQINKIEPGDKKFGIITSGVCYFYAKEVFPKASFLKLGMSYPLPQKTIKAFSSSVKDLYVVEELDPFIEEQIKAMGINVKGKDVLSNIGELSPDQIKIGLTKGKKHFLSKNQKNLSAKKPSLCAGCAYLGLFYIFKKLGLTVIGDIGCYSLLALKPFSILQTCISMGSAPAIANGLLKTAKNNRQKVITIIGDSTFIHSGIAPLIDTVYNKTNNTIVIFDNGTTAMTGGQEHPGTGKTLKNKSTHKLNYKKLALAVGITRVKEINCYDVKKSEKIIKEEIIHNSPSLIIAKNNCLLRTSKKNNLKMFAINNSLCSSCKKCLSLGCPAILTTNNKIFIDKALCSSCGLCKQICPEGAIHNIA